MKFYVGITDGKWFEFLRKLNPDEVNFWRPSATTAFKAIDYGAPFLFKLHKPNDFIVGGGFFSGYSRLPLSMAWQAFGEKNGAANYSEFRERISLLFSRILSFLMKRIGLNLRQIGELGLCREKPMI